VGDQLHTEDGHDVTITALRYDTGYAHVYTLTVANDHTFFVGTARVLVYKWEVARPGGRVNVYCDAGRRAPADARRP
jgi:hypothetical protein